jgi:hypothetical protein
MCFGFSNFKCYWMPKLILFCLYARVIYWKKKRLIAVLTSSDFSRKTSSPNFNFIFLNCFWERT